MSNVVKCDLCSSYYNGATYSTCPYCKKANEPLAESKEDIANKCVNNANEHSFFDFLLSRNKKKKIEDSSNEIDKDHIESGRPMEQADIFFSKTEALPEILERESENIDFINKNNVKDNKTPDLQKDIRKIGRTTGRYMSRIKEEVDTGEIIDPVVGWLVCVKGTYYGQSFNLKSGKNKIGRSTEMQVKLLKDQSVSKSCVACGVFDAKEKVFSLMPGESDSLCYVNGDAVYNRIILTGYEEIEFGDSEENKFIFLPLCSEKFDWITFKEN